MRVLPLLLTIPTVALAEPFFKELGPTKWSIGNELWSIEIGQIYGIKLLYDGKDLVGRQAKGFYAGYDGENNFQYTSARIFDQKPEYLNIVFTAKEVDVHWVIFPALPGAYQYIVNKQLPVLGVLRTLFRLSNSTFNRGRTHIKDDALPALSEFLTAEKVQDETWKRKDGSYITKYDWSAFIREIDFHGVYGNGHGSWFIRPGRDYFNGDDLKQELTVHRESKTGDAVMLNVMHGSHFQANSKAEFLQGKIWGPWLWYLNNGSKDDVARKSKEEFRKWPYSWLNDTGYQSRGEVSGQIMLSDGKPASGASVFLGDNLSISSTLGQGQKYYYTSAADIEGKFHFSNVRAGNYALHAWPNGGSLADVTTQLVESDIAVGTHESKKLKSLELSASDRGRKVFQIGAFDRKSLGFKNGGVPYQHGLVEQSPANLTYTVGKSTERDWYFAQSALGSWTIRFQLNTSNVSAPTSKYILAVSLAGYSKGTNMKIIVNSKIVKTLEGSEVPSDPALYRSGTIAGEWHIFEIHLETRLLKSGWNEVVFEIISTKPWRGFMWDSIWLKAL